MARRSIIQTLRQPALIIPPILFPLILMAINVGGLRRGDEAARLPDRHTTSTSRSRSRSCRARCSRRINAGASSLARDVETGFLKRLALTPMQRAALLIGHLGGVMVVAALSALIYLVVGLRGRAALRGRARSACWCCSCWRC